MDTGNNRHDQHLVLICVGSNNEIDILNVVGEHYFAEQSAVNDLQNKPPAETAVSICIDYMPFSLLNMGYQLAKEQQSRAFISLS